MGSFFMSGSTTDVQQSSIIESHDAASTQNAPKALPPKLRRGAKSKYIIEEHPIMDATGKVVRTRHTGDTYHLFFYVKDEKKWFRKSLHTKRLDQALVAGRELMMLTFAQVRLGERVFPKTYQQVIDEHIKEKQEEADAGLITQGRVTTIKSVMKWVIKFVGGGEKGINSVGGNEWKRYYVFRKNAKPDVRDVTLVNERSAISALFKYADEKRYVSRRHIPIFDKSLSKSREVERRDAFTHKEYSHLCSILQHFDKHGKSDNDRDQRRFIRDFFLISANTGIRFGELRRMRWQQVTVLDQADSDGKPHCEIRLGKADTKNKKARVVQGMRGDFFQRIKEYSKFKEPSDYVFVDNTRACPNFCVNGFSDYN